VRNPCQNQTIIRNRSIHLRRIRGGLEIRPSHQEHQKRKGLYPVLDNHSTQKTELSWAVIRREQRKVREPTQKPPSLMLDSLRECLERAAAQDIWMKSC
jgi:hypothetical protein